MDNLLNSRIAGLSLLLSQREHVLQLLFGPYYNTGSSLG